MVTRSVLRVGPGGPGVPGHTHDGSEIEGVADLIHLRVDQLLAGTITGKEIIVAGGAAGVIRSDNFASGVDGWAIFGDGSAELNDVVVRGTIVAGTGSEVDWSYIKNVVIENADITSLEFSKITAGENDSSLTIGAAGSIASANYSSGSAGFIIEGTGDAEFNDVTVRGAVIAGAGSSIDWGYIDNVSIGSADITDLSFDKITAGSNDASLVIGASGSISSANYAPGTAGFIIKGDGTLEANTGTFRGTIDATAGSLGDLNVTGTLELGSGGEITIPSTAFSDTIVRIGYMTGVPQFGGIEIWGDIAEDDEPSALYSTFGEELTLQVGLANSASFSGTQLLMTSGNAIGFEPGFTFKLYGADSDYLVRHLGDQFSVYTSGIQRLFIGPAGHLEVRTGAVIIPDGSAANPNPRFQSDPDTGPFRVGANTYGIATGGVEQVRIDSDGAINIRTPSTTGSAADLRVGASTLTPIARVTSALKYKSRVTTNVAYLADIDLIPTKHYRADDKRWRYGLIADWLADQDPLLATFDPETGEVENYDDRAVLAVLAAKINELARRVRELEGAA